MDQTIDAPSCDEDGRVERGRQAFAEISGETGDHALGSLKQLAADYSRHAIAFFGDIYRKDRLELRGRQIATIAALATLGTAPSQLRFHIRAGLNVGLTREEIIEVITQLAIYIGSPAVTNGLAAAAEVFAAEDQATSRETGTRA